MAFVFGFPLIGYYLLVIIYIIYYNIRVRACPRVGPIIDASGFIVDENGDLDRRFYCPDEYYSEDEDADGAVQPVTDDNAEAAIIGTAQANINTRVINKIWEG